MISKVALHDARQLDQLRVSAGPKSFFAGIGEPAVALGGDGAFIGSRGFRTTTRFHPSVSHASPRYSLLNRVDQDEAAKLRIGGEGSIAMGVSIASVMEPMPFMASGQPASSHSCAHRSDGRWMRCALAQAMRRASASSFCPVPPCIGDHQQRRLRGCRHGR